MPRSFGSPHAFRDPVGPLPLLLAWLHPREDVRRTSAGVSRGGALFNRLACNVLLRAFRDRKVINENRCMGMKVYVGALAPPAYWKGHRSLHQ